MSFELDIGGIFYKCFYINRFRMTFGEKGLDSKDYAKRSAAWPTFSHIIGLAHTVHYGILILIAACLILTLLFIWFGFPYWMNDIKPKYVLGSILFLIWMWSPYIYVFWLIKNGRTTKKMAIEEKGISIYDLILVFLILATGISGWLYAWNKNNGFTYVGLGLVLPFLQLTIAFVWSLFINELSPMSQARSEENKNSS